MTRLDLVAFETFIVSAYRREAGRRQGCNPQLAETLRAWAKASDRRIDAMKSGPLFADLEEAPGPSNETAKSYAPSEPTEAVRKPLRLFAPNDAAETGDADQAPPMALDDGDPDDIEVPAFLRRLAGAA